MPVFKRIQKMKIDPVSWQSVDNTQNFLKPKNNRIMKSIKDMNNKVGNKIWDMITDEEKKMLKSKLAPRFKDEWEDKVMSVMETIVSAPYTEAWMKVVNDILKK